VAQSTEPIGFGGHTEVPEAGYAITFPDDWTHVRPSVGDIDAIVDELTAMAPDIAAVVEQGLAGGLVFSLMAFAPASPGDPVLENCNVNGGPSGGLSLDFIVAQNVAGLGAFEDLLTTGPDTAMVEMPAGDVGRIDIGWSLEGQPLEVSVYLYTDGETFHTLTCTGAQRPPDDWSSIAETFEFLS
jgi:hypothetical protein